MNDEGNHPRQDLELFQQNDLEELIQCPHVIQGIASAKEEEMHQQ